MERTSPGARSAPGTFGARGTSDEFSCDSRNLLALHHARLLSHSGAAAFTADDAACGSAGASGAAATFLSKRVCCRSVASHARVLAPNGAAAFGAAASAIVDLAARAQAGASMTL